MQTVLPYVIALVPTIGVGTLFYFVMKNIIEADRRERIAQAQWDAEHTTTPSHAPSTVGPNRAQTPSTDSPGATEVR